MKPAGRPRLILLVLLLMLLFMIPGASTQERLQAPDKPTASGNTAAWNVVPGATGYRLRWRRGNEDWHNPVTMDVSQRSYEIAGLEAGVQYDVEVRALGDDLYNSDSDWSDHLILTLPAPGELTKLNTPTNLSWMPNELSWHKVSHATEAEHYYAEYRSDGQDCRGKSNFGPTKSDILYDTIICEGDRCLKRFYNACRGGQFIVKAQNVSGYLDSEEATLVASQHSVSDVLILDELCDEHDGGSRDFELKTTSGPYEYQEERWDGQRGPSICTKMMQLICYDRNSAAATQAASELVGIAVNLRTSYSGPISTFLGTWSTRMTNLIVSRNLLDSIALPDVGWGFLDTDEIWCVDRDDPYPTPVISTDYVFTPPNRWVIVKWRGESDFYDVLINGEPYPQDGATSRSAYPYSATFIVEPDTQYVVQVRSNHEDARAHGTGVRANSEWSDSLVLQPLVKTLATPTG